MCPPPLIGKLDHASDRIGEIQPASPCGEGAIIIPQIGINRDSIGAALSRLHLAREAEVVLEIVTFVKVGDDAARNVNAGKADAAAGCDDPGGSQYQRLGAAGAALAETHHIAAR